MSHFKDKVLLITGGTGSFGNAVLNGFLNTDIKEIRIFSRDEKKQDDMRHEFQAKMPEVVGKIKFFIGDVRDLQSIKNAMHGVDYIFHMKFIQHIRNSCYLCFSTLYPTSSICTQINFLNFWQIIRIFYIFIHFIPKSLIFFPFTYSTKIIRIS